MSEEQTAGEKRRDRKKRFKTKMESLLREYNNILIVGIDNVGSLQMQKIRIALRGKAVICCGKNTLMRKIIRDEIPAKPKLEALLEHIVGNMGLIFTNGDLAEVRNTVVAFKVPAAAKTGTTAPADVFVPAGPTGLDPGQTGFFQALNIATKIARGSIEIVNVVHLIKLGDKVTSSAVALLSKLNLQPFFYGVVALTAYENGSLYPVSILDITQADLQGKFLRSVGQLTALSLAVKFPSQLTLPVYIASGFRKLLAISLASGYSFKEAEALRNAKPAPAAEEKKDAGKGKDAGKKEAPAKKEKEPEPEEEDVSMGGLFD